MLRPARVAEAAFARAAMNAASGTNPPLNRGMITVSIMLATIMQVVDMTIVNVALPHMQGSMSATRGPDLLGAHVVHRVGGDHHPADRPTR